MLHCVWFVRDFILFLLPEGSGESLTRIDIENNEEVHFAVEFHFTLSLKTFWFSSSTKTTQCPPSLWNLKYRSTKLNQMEMESGNIAQKKETLVNEYEYRKNIYWISNNRLYVWTHKNNYLLRTVFSLYNFYKWVVRDEHNDYV